MPSRLNGINSVPVANLQLQSSKRKSKKRKRNTTEGILPKLMNSVREPLASVQLDKAMCPGLKATDPPAQFLQLWLPIPPQQPMKDTIFGMVPDGSLLSYQLPKQASSEEGDIVVVDAAKPPPFNFPSWTSLLNLPLNRKDQQLFDSYNVTVEQALEYEEGTREQSDCKEWHSLRKVRITASKFKRCCGQKADLTKLAASLQSGKTIQTLYQERNTKKCKKCQMLVQYQPSYFVTLQESPP